MLIAKECGLSVFVTDTLLNFVVLRTWGDLSRQGLFPRFSMVVMPTLGTVGNFFNNIS